MQKSRVQLLALTLCLSALSISGDMLNDHVESIALHEALAAPSEAEAAISGSCDDSPVTAFSPDIAYTITFPSPARAAISTCSATAELTGAVNSDTTPSITCVLGAIDGYIVTYHDTPTMKLGGLQCEIEDRSQLQVHGDGSDNVNFDIAIQSAGSTTWDASKKVDDATAGAKDMLFGTSGQIGSSAIVDGSDHDTATNGEVDFGGTTPNEGASHFFIKLDFTDYDVQASSEKEDLTFTFTAE
jgi:hypothetical protein